MEHKPRGRYKLTELMRNQALSILNSGLITREEIQQCTNYTELAQLLNKGQGRFLEYIGLEVK